MRLSRIIVTTLVLTFLAAGTIAQQLPQPVTSTPPAAEPRKAASPILEQIPAGALGFVVIDNVRNSAANVDTFLQQIGMGHMMPPGGILTAIKATALPGGNFNENGGLALVMLDPEQFGLDLVGLMTPSPATSRPAIEPEDLPILLILAAENVKEVFGEAAVAEGEHFRVTLGETPLLAAQKGDYVILTASPAALKAVTSATKSAADELDKQHADFIARSDIAVYGNIKVIGPLYVALFKQMQPQTDFPLSINTYSDTMAQFDAMTMSIRLTPNEVVTDILASYTPGSKLAKSVAETAAIEPAIDRVANLPYVLALRSAGAGPETAAMSLDMVRNLVHAIATELSEDKRVKIITIYDALLKQVTGYQFVGGGAPMNSGVFGLACVLECKDADAVIALLSDELVPLIQSLIPAATTAPSEATTQASQGVTVSYVKGAETIAGAAIDAIDVDGLPMPTSESQLNQMRQILGETRLRLRIVKVDPKTVVITLGGAAPFMAESIKAAKGGSRLLSTEQSKKLAKYLPARLNGLGLINVANLMEVILTGARTISPGSAPPFTITTKDPVVIAGGTSGDNTQHSVLLVPNGLVRDVTQLIMMFTMQRRATPPSMMQQAPSGPVMPPSEDF